jgi:hypothetical protein
MYNKLFTAKNNHVQYCTGAFVNFCYFHPSLIFASKAGEPTLWVDSSVQLAKQKMFLQPGKTNWKGRLSTVDLLVITSLDKLHLILKTLFTFLQKRATLMRRSTVLSLLLQLVFPASTVQPLPAQIWTPDPLAMSRVPYQLCYRCCLPRSFVELSRQDSANHYWWNCDKDIDAIKLFADVKKHSSLITFVKKHF